MKSNGKSEVLRSLCDASDDKIESAWKDLVKLCKKFYDDLKKVKAFQDQGSIEPLEIDEKKHSIMIETVDSSDQSGCWLEIKVQENGNYFVSAEGGGGSFNDTIPSFGRGTDEGVRSLSQINEGLSKFIKKWS